MDAEELDYSDEDIKGDINTEDENSLLGINNENDANRAELNDFLELDCPDDYQEEENCSTKGDQNSTAVEEKGAAQKGKSPQNQNQSQNQRNNPKTNERQSRNKNFKRNNKDIVIDFNMKKNNGYNNLQPRSRSRSRSESRSRPRPQTFNKNQNRDFPVKNLQNENKQFQGSPWMPNADPNLLQNAKALMSQRSPTIFPAVAASQITQQALHHANSIQQVIQNLQQSAAQGRPVHSSGFKGNVRNDNISRPSVNQFPSERPVGFKNSGFNNYNQRSLLGPAPGTSTSSFNNALGTRTGIPQIPPPLIDTSLLRPRRDGLLRPQLNNTPAFNRSNFQRTNEHTPFGVGSSNSDNFRTAPVNASTPKPLMENDLRRTNFQMPSASNLMGFDVSLKAFDSRIQNNLPQNDFITNKGSSMQQFQDFQITRHNTSFQAETRHQYPSRFIKENANSSKNGYDHDCNNTTFSSGFKNKNSSNNNNNINRNNSNFRRNSRNESKNFKNNNYNMTKRRNTNEINYRVDDFKSNDQSTETGNKPNNFNDQAFRRKQRFSQSIREPGNEEPKPQVKVEVPEITPEVKELVNQKKAERLQRFQNQSLVNYEVSSSQSSVEWTVDQGDLNDSLEIDAEYLKGIEEQKKKREEVMKQKLLKRKSNDNAFMSDVAETKPYKKPHMTKKEVLKQKYNPFGESDLEIIPSDIKKEDTTERGAITRFNGSLLPNFDNQTMTSSPSATSMEEVGLGRNSRSHSPFPQQRCKSPYPGQKNQPGPVLGVMPRAKSPHPGKSKTPQPMEVESTVEVPRPKSPYPRSATPKFVWTEDMIPIQKTIFNEYAHSNHGSDASSSHSMHFIDNQKQPDSFFNGDAVKILNLPNGLSLDDLRKMCSPFGKTLEVKLSPPGENSAGIRFETSTSAQAFYQRYHRQKVGGNFLDVIII